MASLFCGFFKRHHHASTLLYEETLLPALGLSASRANYPHHYVFFFFVFFKLARAA
jgi:hypothetical protein